MKLVRRKRKRKPRLVIWVGHGYFTANSRGEKVIWVHDPYLVIEYFPSHRGDKPIIVTEDLELRPWRRRPKRRLIPRPPHKRFPPQFPLDLQVPLPFPPDKPRR